MITATPPAVPACRLGDPWDAREHLMIWVHTGQAHVRLPDGQEHRIDASTGIWLPSGINHDVWTEPGSLAFPTWVPPHAVPGGPAHVTRFTVEDGWRDWLIAHFAHAYTTYDQVSPADLGQLLSASIPSSPQIRREIAESGCYPPVPQRAPARTVARALLRNPALDYTVEQWAIQVACSANTLRRDFLRDTDMTFAQWRSRCRMAAACEFLAAGYDVSQVAARAGFASRNGFTRAFREHHGITPRDYALMSTDGLPSRRIVTDREAGALARLLDDASAAVPTVPAGRNAPITAPYNVLTWIYRGSGWARVGETTYSRKKGDTIWLPAGMERETGLPDGSLSLPIGVLDTNDAQISQPLRTRFPRAWETYLLYCSVSTNTSLRPERYDPRHILDVFSRQLALERAQTVPMPKNADAREAAISFLRRIGTSSESTTFGVPDGIHEAFRRDTGMTFSRWRNATRMRIARDLLVNDTQPSAVAGRVGYSQVSNFSRAFMRFHGISPREYQERELEVP